MASQVSIKKCDGIHVARLFLYRDKLRHNYHFLQELFRNSEAEFSIVTKLLCGNKRYLKEVLDLGPKQICESRISNLKAVKQINPLIETIYIKPPSPSVIKSLIKYADISFNTEYEIIKMLSREAKTQNKTHKVILMIELGDLREGILSESLEEIYARILELENIEVIGIGSNLNCLHGVMPSLEKLNILCRHKENLEKKFKKEIKYISGGTTVTLPLLLSEKLFPARVNHFRIGEALFFGADLFNDKTIKGMFPFTFELEAQVIEVSEKPSEPFGEVRANPQGIKYQKNNHSQIIRRAILDIGVLDVQPQYLIPNNPKVKVIGASSDMLVIDISESRHNYPIGSTMKFQLKYMGALGLLNSKYIDKEVL